MSRFNLILVGIAVLQLLLLGVFKWSNAGDDLGGDGADSRAGQKPLEKLVDKDVSKIEITDDEGKTLLLGRGEGDDAPFTLQAVGNYPVRASQAKKVMDDLKTLTLGRVVTRQKGNFVKLSVADSKFDRRVKVFDRGGKTIADFFIGNGKKFDTVVYRDAGRDVAYHATGVSTFDLNTDTSSWVETRFTEWEEADVKSVKLENEKGTFELTRAEPKTPETAPEPTEPKPDDKVEPKWTVTLPADAAVTLDETKVNTFVGGFGRLYMGSPVGAIAGADMAALGLDKPSATATITMKDGTVHLLKLGGKKGTEDEFHVIRSGFEFIVTLRGYAADNHFRKALTDLAPEPKEDPATPDGEPGK